MEAEGLLTKLIKCVLMEGSGSENYKVIMVYVTHCIFSGYN